MLKTPNNPPQTPCSTSDAAHFLLSPYSHTAQSINCPLGLHRLTSVPRATRSRPGPRSGVSRPERRLGSLLIQSSVSSISADASLPETWALTPFFSVPFISNTSLWCWSSSALCPRPSSYPVLIPQGIAPTSLAVKTVRELNPSGRRGPPWCESCWLRCVRPDWVGINFRQREMRVSTHRVTEEAAQSIKYLPHLTGHSLWRLDGPGTSQVRTFQMG